MGAPDLPSDTPGTACNKKIDLLFISSPSSDTVDSVYNSYSGILAVIQDVFADFDLHVMFADEDDRWSSPSCLKGMCPEEGGCLAEGYEDFPCWVYYDDDELTECDHKIGAGITFPAGSQATNKRCELLEGQRYINGDDPLFAERFECLFHVGLSVNSADGARWAMGEAVSPTAQAKCNAGFLREDALLLAVIMAPNDLGPYNSHVHAMRVLEAKNSDPDMVVALGISKDWNAIPNAVCEFEKDEIPASLYYWTKKFEHSVFGSICAPSLVPFFVEATTMAAQLCDGAPD